MPEEGSRRRSWREHTVLAAVISAAAILGAGLGGAVIANTGWPGDEPAAPQPTVTVTRYVTETAAGSSPSASPTGTVRWTGELTLTQDFADLDAVAPNNAADAGSNDVRLSSWGSLSVPEKSLRWTASGNPTEQECAARLRTDGFDQHDYEDRAEAGQRYCLVTSGGRTALVRFKGAVTMTGTHYSAKVRVTVWSNADG